ncbi:MAG: Crp/Fnr family transcriptional regulator [Flavobacteriaceae bacterium]
MKKLVAAIDELHPLSEESKKEFSKILEVQNFKKKTVIAELGEVPSHFYILKSGIVRSYIADEKGKEFTRSLYTSITAVGAFSALIKQEPSNIIYECLTDCELYAGDFNKFKKLVSENTDLAILYSKVLELLFVKMEKRILELSMLDAKQRYLKLKRRIPKIENLIPQYHIASYLNITPVQLSRIRKSLYRK